MPITSAVAVVGNRVGNGQHVSENHVIGDNHIKEVIHSNNEHP